MLEIFFRNGTNYTSMLALHFVMQLILGRDKI
jgi:hypothetical protein